MADFLIECLITSPKETKYVLGGFMAGYELSAWLKHLRRLPDARAIIEFVASELTREYGRADEMTRKRIETSCL